MAGPHPAAICLLPAMNPDDDAALGSLPHAEALLARLSWNGCFVDGGCGCLKRHGLCDEMREKLDMPAGAPDLDGACGVSCAKPLTTAGASRQAAHYLCRAQQAPPCACARTGSLRKCLRLY